jgi:hypothetical protein
MYDIPFDRSFLQLSELTAKASMAQPVSQPAVYANGLKLCIEIKRRNLRGDVMLCLCLLIDSTTLSVAQVTQC